MTRYAYRRPPTAIRLPLTALFSDKGKNSMRLSPRDAYAFVEKLRRTAVSGKRKASRVEDPVHYCLNKFLTRKKAFAGRSPRRRMK